MRAAPVISGVNRTGASDHVSWLAAVEALQAVWRLPLEDPRREAMHAIAYRPASTRPGFGRRRHRRST